MFFYSYCDLTGNLTDLFILPLLSKYAKVTLNFVLLHQQRLNNKKTFAYFETHVFVDRDPDLVNNYYAPCD